MRKGFVNSLLVIAIAALLLELLFAFQVHTVRLQDTEQRIFTAGYAVYYFDDISYDVFRLANDSLAFSRMNSTYLEISFSRTDDPSDFLSRMGNYTSEFSAYAAKVGANMTLNSSSVGSSGFVYSFSNGMSYAPAYGSANRSVLVSSPSAAPKNYSIVLRIPYERGLLTDFNYNESYNATGVFVRMSVSDGNGTYSSEGYLDGAQPNVFSIDYSNGGRFEAQVRPLGGNPSSFQSVMGNITGTTMNVDAVIESSDSNPVTITVPVYLNVTSYAYSKYGAIRSAGT